MKNDLERLLFDQNTYDLTLVVGDDGSHPESILAHRSILCARSPVFYAMLQSREDHEEMKCVEAWYEIVYIFHLILHYVHIIIGVHDTRRRENTVRIKDIEPTVMKTLLMYIYTDQCSQSALALDADKIMCAAVKYQVHMNV